MTLTYAKGKQLAIMLELAGRAQGVKAAELAEVLKIDIVAARKRAGNAVRSGHMVASTDMPRTWRATGKQINSLVNEKPGLPASVRIKPVQMSKSVDASNAKITRDTTPRPTAAYQMLKLPADPRYPSYAGMGVGHYDEVTQ